jgi:hypothetical protein
MILGAPCFFPVEADVIASTIWRFALKVLLQSRGEWWELGRPEGVAWSPAITEGAVFRPVAKGGRIQATRPTDRSVADIGYRASDHAARNGNDATVPSWSVLLRRMVPRNPSGAPH